MENNNLNQNTNKVPPQKNKIPVPKIPAPEHKNPPVVPQVEQIPELALKANANDNKVKVPDIEPVVKKGTKGKVKETLDIGPIKKKFNFKKLLKLLGIGTATIFAIGIIYIGYLYFINQTPEDVSEERIRRIRDIKEREIDDDPTSLDMLEKRFDDFGDRVKLLEEGASFENRLNLGRKDF